MQKITVFVGMVLFFGINCCFAQEQLTITTYYPSPYGSYRELRSQRMAIGPNYYDSGTYPWDEGGGCAANEICNADFVVEGNVGIGTRSPTAELDVAGNVKIAGNLEVAGTITPSAGVPSGYCIFPAPGTAGCPAGYTSQTIPLLSHSHGYYDDAFTGWNCGFPSHADCKNTGGSSGGQQFMCCKD